MLLDINELETIKKNIHTMSCVLLLHSIENDIVNDVIMKEKNEKEDLKKITLTVVVVDERTSIDAIHAKVDVTLSSKMMSQITTIKWLLCPHHRFLSSFFN
ncbi:CLUMA_CG002827, isoform A [Clunio marinus]|uniref:CLUMA_CG002827, isoform A n=1 Tax=Clunio marinus TaxID=568069 RepID=A0A1J1HRB5_9DIPT|nr:CLUMA_CG002827, isoform A [Clunio marinus]